MQYLRAVLLSSILTLPACINTPSPPPAPLALTPPLPRPGLIAVQSLGTDSMRRGSEVGRYVWAIDCGEPTGALYWTGAETLTGGTPFPARIREELRNDGYQPLDEQADEKTARVRLKGQLKAVSLKLCRRSHWLTGTDRGVSGEGSVEVEWTLRDAHDRRELYRSVTNGKGSLEDGVPKGEAAIVERAVVAAARALAVDPRFSAVFAEPAVAESMPVTETSETEAAPVAVGARVRAEWAGRSVTGTIAGRSRDRDGDRPVVLVDFGGTRVAEGAQVVDEAGLSIGTALASGLRIEAAWYGLTPIVRDRPTDRIDRAPSPPT